MGLRPARCLACAPGLLFTGSVRMLPGLRRGFCPPRTLLRSDLRAPRGPRFVQRRLGTRAAGRPWFPKSASPRHFPHSVFRPNGPYVALFAPRTRFRSVVGPHLPPRKGRAEHCRTAWRQGNAAKGASQGTPSGETSCDPVPTPVSFSCPRIAGTPSLASMIDRPSAGGRLYLPSLVGSACRGESPPERSRLCFGQNIVLRWRV